MTINRIDSCDINKMIIEESNKEYDKEYKKELDGLLNELHQINNLHDEFTSLVNSQTEKINHVEKSIENTADKIDSSNTQLLSASGHQKSIFMQKGVLLTACTTAVTAPVWVFVGAKVAIAAGVVTAGYGLYTMS